MIREVAGAKINLFLHVGPVRPDGLHELASLFMFARDGDAIEVAAANDMTLEVGGPFASPLRGLPSENNLVMKAARRLQAVAGVRAGARIRLDKQLPIAAGIGGGSADAAATLRALTKLWEVRADPAELRDLAFSIGADVPACLDAAPVLVRGAGERIELAPSLPPLWVCLVNPRVETPTGPIFLAFDLATPSPSAPKIEIGLINSYPLLMELIESTRNDLEPFAIAHNPVIADARNFLSQCAGAFGARMSGSGSTVFALFAAPEQAEQAARGAQTRGWWSLASPIMSRLERS